MKSVFATVALATAAAAAPTVTIYTATSAFPTTLPTECTGMSLTAVKSSVTDKVVFKTIAGTTDQAAANACVAAANAAAANSVTVLTATDADYKCANDAADAVVAGAAAACPLAAGDACTTVLNTCAVGFTCLGAVPAEGTTPAKDGVCRVQLYTDAAVFPSPVPAGCENLKFTGPTAAGQSKPLFQSIVKADGGAAAAVDITKCAGTTAFASLPKVTEPILSCASFPTNTPLVPAINAGVNASCPLAKGDACTQEQFCVTDTKCKDNTATPPVKVCTAIDFTTVQIKTDSATAFTVAATDAASTQVANAQKVAMDIVMKDCKDPTGVATWIAKKDAKQLVKVVKGDKDCLVAANVKKELEAAYKTSSDVKDANKITVASVDQKDLSTWEKCLVEGEYVCAGEAKDCTAIKCNLAEACTKNDDCGTDNCTTTKGADGKEVKQCAVSGSALASTMMAVGAAVVAAMLF